MSFSKPFTNFGLSTTLKHSFTPVTMGTHRPPRDKNSAPNPCDDDDAGTQPTLLSSCKGSTELSRGDDVGPEPLHDDDEDNNDDLGRPHSATTNPHATALPQRRGQ